MSPEKDKDDTPQLTDALKPAKSIMKYIDLDQPSSVIPRKTVRFEDIDRDTKRRKVDSPTEEEQLHAQQPSVLHNCDTPGCNAASQGQSEPTMNVASLNTRELIKAHYTNKIQWNGTSSDFQLTKKHMESLFLEMHSSTLLKNNFLREYAHVGLTRALGRSDLLRRFGVSRRTFEEAVSYLYRWIECMSQFYAPARKAINPHRQTKDGLMAWTDLVASQDSFLCSSNRTLIFSKHLLRDSQSDRYHKRPRHNRQILDALWLGNAHTPEQRMQVLINNLSLTRANPSDITYMKEHFTTIGECANYLR